MGLFDIRTTYLDEKGNWVSNDGTLYQPKAASFEFGKETEAKPDITTPIKAAFKLREKAVKIGEASNKKFEEEQKAKALARGRTPEEAEKEVAFTRSARELAEGFGPSGLVGSLKKVDKAKGIIEKGKELIGKVRERGFVTSVKEAFPEIKKVAGQYIPRSTDDLAIKARNLVSDNLAQAEQVAKGTDDKAVATVSELVKFYSQKAIEASDEITRTALYDKAAEVANDAARRLTELGRAVQAASILGRLTPEGQLRFAAREIQKYNEGLGFFGRNKKIPDLTGEQSEEILNKMKEIEGLPEGLEKAMQFKKLQDYISSLVPSSLFDKVLAVWKAGLLTGVKTTGINIFSNLSHSISEVAKDVPAGVVDSVTSLFTGERKVVPTIRGVAKGIKEGFEKGVRYLKTGFDERDIASKLDYKKVNFGKGPIAKALQKYEETVFRLLGSEDQVFYYGAKSRSLYDQALAQAKTAGLKGAELKKFIDDLVSNPTDEMVRYAVLDAETAVFQNPTKLGEIASKIQQTKPLGFVLPFGKTPSAVAMQILNYSPVGIVKTIIENIGKGKFDQRLFSQGLGRGLTGTIPLVIGYELAKKGMVSLDRPTSERERELQDLEGRKPNSVLIDGKWRSPLVFGPAGSLLLAGAQFYEAYKETGSPTEAIQKGVFGAAKSFTEQTFLTGIKQISDALNDPERFATGYLGQFVASFVPTIISDIARSTDPLERRTATGSIESILERIQARIPGARRELEPQVDVLGKERKRVGNILEVMADPTRPSPKLSSPLVDELRRLFDEGYAVSPTRLGDRAGYKVLTAKQNTELWKRSGEITEEKLRGLINREEYKQLPDDKKAKLVDKFVDQAKIVARAEAVLEATEGLSGEVLKQKLSELKKGKLMTSEVFDAYLKLR